MIVATKFLSLLSMLYNVFLTFRIHFGDIRLTTPHYKAIIITYSGTFKLRILVKTKYGKTEFSAFLLGLTFAPFPARTFPNNLISSTM